MRVAKAAVASAVLLFAFPAFGASYRSYVNGRFGTQVEVPTGWRAEREPDNGGGRKFVSPDGRASITASGAFHVSDDIAEEVDTRLQPDEGETITYRHKGVRDAVVSGTRSQRIFYRKSILACGDRIWHDVAIEYPAAEKSAYDAMVRHVAGSLRQGRGLQAEDCE